MCINNVIIIMKYVICNNININILMCNMCINM